MTEPENALTKQYQALVTAEGAELEFTPDGIAEVARVAFMANDRMENIGARRAAHRHGRADGRRVVRAARTIPRSASSSMRRMCESGWCGSSATTISDVISSSTKGLH